ncbi:hypothetical protein OSTOST_03408, partial [Ostertagia ostertagi]
FFFQQQRCPDNTAPVYDPGRFSPPQLDTPPPPVLNTAQQADFDNGGASGDDIFSFEKHNNNCWSSSAKMNSHPVTRKFSLADNFYSPHPQHHPDSGDTCFSTYQPTSHPLSKIS